MALLEDLLKAGWRDEKIETACGYATGYVAHLRRGDIVEMKYSRAARLWNLWTYERRRLHSENQTLVATT